MLAASKYRNVPVWDLVEPNVVCNLNKDDVVLVTKRANDTTARLRFGGRRDRGDYQVLLLNGSLGIVATRNVREL